jgi:hypothetical protein
MDFGRVGLLLLRRRLRYVLAKRRYGRADAKRCGKQRADECFHGPLLLANSWRTLDLLLANSWRTPDEAPRDRLNSGDISPATRNPTRFRSIPFDQFAVAKGGGERDACEQGDIAGG